MLNTENTSMTIGSLAKAASMSVETIRYYQRRGLVPQPEKPYGGIRRYDGHTLERLHFIRTAQWLGFSLEEIGKLLLLEDGAHCSEAKELGTQKLLQVREKIRNLQQIEQVLEQLVKTCSVQTGNINCPLIRSLHDGAQLKLHGAPEHLTDS